MGTSGTTLCSEVVQTPRVSQAQGRHPATSSASLLCCSPHLQPCPCRRTHTPIPPGCVPGGLLPPPHFGLGPRQGEAALGTSSEQRGPATSLCSSPHLLRPADTLLPQKRPPRTTLSRADKPEQFPHEKLRTSATVYTFLSVPLPCPQPNPELPEGGDKTVLPPTTVPPQQQQRTWHRVGNTHPGNDWVDVTWQTQNRDSDLLANLLSVISRTYANVLKTPVPHPRTPHMQGPSPAPGPGGLPSHLSRPGCGASGNLIGHSVPQFLPLWTGMITGPTSLHSCEA